MHGCALTLMSGSRSWSLCRSSTYHRRLSFAIFLNFVRVDTPSRVGYGQHHITKPTYQVDVRGNTRSRGIKGTTALSWGVFPNREVQQPTIFDPETYMVRSRPCQ